MCLWQIDRRNALQGSERVDTTHDEWIHTFVIDMVLFIKPGSNYNEQTSTTLQT